MFADIQHLQLLAQGGGNPVPIYFGATYIDSSYTGTHLSQDFDAPTGYGESTEGAFNGYAAINAQWVDTTDLDNFRADGTGNLEVNAASGEGFGNTVHYFSTNTTPYGYGY